MRDIVAVPQKHDFKLAHFGKRPALTFPKRHDIRQHLTGMFAFRQAIDHRHARVARKLLNIAMPAGADHRRHAHSG